MGVVIGIYQKKHGGITAGYTSFKGSFIGTKRLIFSLKTVPEWPDLKVKTQGHKVNLK